MVKQYDKKWFQLDLARQKSFHREETEELLKTLKKCGYNGLCLYIEGYFHFPEFDGVPREGCMTKEDAAWVMETAKRYDMSIIPMTNLIGHAKSFLSQERYSHFAKIETQFELKSQGLYEFIKKIIDQLVDCFDPSFIHIGGDEVKLESEEDRKDYVELLCEMHEHLKSKGIETGIWGDMFLKHPEMAEYMNKDVWVFDWWYYGHRYESTKMLKDAGFKNIVICPGTQSWDGIVGAQQMCPWKELLPWKCEEDVAGDEVEAFLIDAQEQDAYNALLCDWETYNGHLTWNSMHLVARFGQFVNGKGISDEELNNCLFGRQTPYMECMHMLMDAQKLCYEEYKKLPGKLVTHQHTTDSLFNPRAFCKLLQCGDWLSPELMESYLNAASNTRQLIENWKAENSFEDRLKRNIRFASDYAQASGEILKLSSATKALYRQTSYEQFKDPKKYSEMLHKVQQDFTDFAESIPAWKETLEAAICDSGHTKEDLSCILKTKKLTEEIVLSLGEYDIGAEKYEKKIALPSWKKLLCSVLGEVKITD